MLVRGGYRRRVPGVLSPSTQSDHPILDHRDAEITVLPVIHRRPNMLLLQGLELQVVLADPLEIVSYF